METQPVPSHSSTERRGCTSGAISAAATRQWMNRRSSQTWLPTIRVRLIICSIDKAQQIGLDWWRYDQHFAPGRRQVELEREQLREQVRLLERKIETLTRPTPAAKRAARNRT